MDERRRESVDRFAAVADEDLRVAKLCLGADPPALRMAASHAQQAAEKYLKAWLVALGEDEPPVTHSLPHLADMIAARGGPTLPRPPLKFLTRFAVAPRYGLAEVASSNAERAVREASTLVESAVEAIEELRSDEGETNRNSPHKEHRP